MLDKYNNYLKLVQYKLQSIDFYLEEEDICSVTYGNDTTWKIIFEGDRFLESDPSYNIFIQKIDSPDIQISRIGFSIIVLMEIYIATPNFKLENMLDFIIEYKDKIFDETFPYKEKYNELK